MSRAIDDLRQSIRTANVSLTNVAGELTDLYKRLSENHATIIAYQENVKNLKACIRRKNERIAHLEKYSYEIIYPRREKN